MHLSQNYLSCQIYNKLCFLKYLLHYSYQTIFFHCSQFKGDFRKLNISDKVSFELVISDKINSINVKLFDFNDSQE